MQKYLAGLFNNLGLSSNINIYIYLDYEVEVDSY